MQKTPVLLALIFLALPLALFGCTDADLDFAREKAGAIKDGAGTVAEKAGSAAEKAGSIAEKAGGIAEKADGFRQNIESGFTNPPAQPPGANEPVSVVDSNGLLIAAWNLQIFGKSKAEKEWLMEYYAEKMSSYDIIVVQEIRDKSGTAFEELCEKLSEYECIVSERTGTSNVKEQYGVIYRGVENDGVEFVGQKDWSEKQDLFERPPFEATFRKGDWTFTLITIHTRPDSVPGEMKELEKLLEGREDEEIIILGDLNADCDYYNNSKEDDFEPPTWIWVVPDTEDTTVAKTDCAYDRIIYSEPVSDNFVEYGVMRDVNSDESDHYLVWSRYNYAE